MGISSPSFHSASDRLLAGESVCGDELFRVRDEAEGAGLLMSMKAVMSTKGSSVMLLRMSAPCISLL